MPKQTFLNLPDEKRDAFLGIALEEFADNDYHSASVSRIVEKAGIAKGSLYQYFEDKQDLFLYLLEVANRMMMGYIRESAPPNPAADFFETLRWQMSATVGAAVRFPVHARLARRAYSAPLPFRETVLENAKTLREEHFQGMIQQAQAAGQLDPALDPAVVSFMVQGLMNDLGPFLQARFGESGDDWLERPEVGQVFDQVVRVLKGGLGQKYGG